MLIHFLSSRFVRRTEEHQGNHNNEPKCSYVYKPNRSIFFTPSDLSKKRVRKEKKKKKEIQEKEKNMENMERSEGPKTAWVQESGEIKLQSKRISSESKHLGGKESKNVRQRSQS